MAQAVIKYTGRRSLSLSLSFSPDQMETRKRKNTKKRKLLSVHCRARYAKMTCVVRVRKYKFYIFSYVSRSRARRTSKNVCFNARFVAFVKIAITTIIRETLRDVSCFRNDFTPGNMNFECALANFSRKWLRPLTASEIQQQNNLLTRNENRWIMQTKKASSPLCNQSVFHRTDGFGFYLYDTLEYKYQRKLG